jgi:uncharacterized protein YceH (UPF0502 family)
VQLLGGASEQPAAAEPRDLEERVARLEEQVAEILRRLEA